jgi:hypothetical protein
MYPWEGRKEMYPGKEGRKYYIQDQPLAEGTNTHTFFLDARGRSPSGDPSSIVGHDLSCPTRSGSLGRLEKCAKSSLLWSLLEALAAVQEWEFWSFGGGICGTRDPKTAR